MIRDLSASVAEPLQQADIVVIGAGIAGLILATRAAKAGRRVVVLESGGPKQDAETHPLNATEQIGDTYKGADIGRFRCLGGTSTRWGGALIPFAAEDFTVHPRGWDADWLGIDRELTPYLGEAEALFALPKTGYDDVATPPLEIEGECAFLPRIAKWPSFSRRNVAHLLGPDIEAESGPLVWLDATATGFKFHADGKLAQIDAQSPSGKSLAVSAPQFVIAAGAIESTRLLLLADRAADARIFAPHDVLGRYFHDHIADTVGSFTEMTARSLNRIAGFRFEAGCMRNLRFEAAGSLRRRQNLPAAFAHITFASPGASAFDGLRDILRAIQRRELPAWSTVTRLTGSSGWLAQAIWWRLVHKRLLFPDAVQLQLDIVVEQEPSRQSRIDLSSRRDAFGQPLARIDWRVSAADVTNIVRMADLFAQAWGTSTLERVAKFSVFDAARRAAKVSTSGGVYHPGGSTRMGSSAVTGVVDRDLRAFGIPNLTVVSTSTFPTGGGANPTMMLVLAALRAADRLAGTRS